MDYIKLGRRIKEYRLKAMMTQEKLAEVIELSAVYISQIEHGRRKLSLESLVKIANALNVTIDILLMDSLNQNDDIFINQLMLLLRGHTEAEISLVIEIVKTVFKV